MEKHRCSIGDRRADGLHAGSKRLCVARQQQRALAGGTAAHMAALALTTDRATFSAIVVRYMRGAA